MPFISEPDSSVDLIISMISFISSFEMNNVVVQDSKLFLWMAISVADAAVYSNNIKMPLANGLSTVPIKGNPVFNNGPKSLSKNRPDCPILRNRVFEGFALADEPFAKSLWNFESYVLVNNTVCRKLFSLSESPATFDEILIVTSVLFYQFYV